MDIITLIYFRTMKDSGRDAVDIFSKYVTINGNENDALCGGRFLTSLQGAALGAALTRLGWFSQSLPCAATRRSCCSSTATVVCANRQGNK